MSEPITGTAESELPRGPESPPAVATASPDESGGLFTVGQRWRDLVIESVLKDHPPHSYLANHLGLMERVILRAFRIEEGTEWRRGAWDQLVTMTDVGTIRCLSALEENGWRYEMTAVPPSTTMREWISLHQAGSTEIESFVRRTAAILGALHAQGIVHLNIRPESIYVDDAGDEPVFLLGGLHEATLYTHPQVAPASLDPYYAPPETAGGARPRSGTRLCAWDWWSVGRVTQEYLLGKHVLSLVLDCDVVRQTPELRAKAERLLLEQEPTGVRAGALDYMPENPTIQPVLRGLLTGSCEARWGLDAVQRWLRHEPVLDHYDLPTTARLWSWQGRIFTIAEAAEFFTQMANWSAGEDVLFNSDDPASLVHFLGEAKSYAAELARLNAVNGLCLSGALAALADAPRRSIAAALAWMSLATGAGGKPFLRVRGRVADFNGVALLLRDGAEAGVPIVMALLAPEVIEVVEGFDAPSARMLKEIAAKGGEAVRLAWEHHWLAETDVDAHARLLTLTLQPAVTLREKVEPLRKIFATSADPVLAAWLEEKTPTPVQLALLAYTAETPERYGYITHEVWRRQQAEELKDKGDHLVTTLVWLRLQQLLRIAWLWGTPSTFFGGIVLVLTAVVAWVGRSFLLVSAIAVPLMLSRVWLWWRVRRILRRFDPGAAPWEWRADGHRRCAVELARVFDGERPNIKQPLHDLREVRRRMAKLKAENWKAPLIAQPQWLDVYGAIAITAMVVVAAFVLVTIHPQIRSAKPPPPAPPAHAEPAATKAEGPKPPPTPEELIATGRYEMVDDGFGRRLRGPLEKWNHFSPAEVPAAEVVARSRASSEQAAFAVVSGMLLLQPYAQKGIRVLLAVRVPSSHGFAVMLYNARDRVLADPEILLLKHELAPGDWARFGSRRALYLGQSVPLDLEISLAPP